MIKMCIFDVDGTLYDYYHHRILDSTIETIQKLKENNIICVIATGRVHYGLGRALDDLKMDYVIAVNGAVIASQDEVLERFDFSLEDVLDILTFSREEEAGLCFKFIDKTYIYQHPEKIDWYEGQTKSDIGTGPFKDCFSQDHHFIDLPQSASIHAPYDKIKMAFQKHPRLDFVQYSEDGFDIVLKGINKGVGIEKLANLLNIQKDEIMVIGDNYNDLEMFDKAGIRVAMGNAVEAVKEKADYVTADCASDGIYQAAKYFNLI